MLQLSNYGHYKNHCPELKKRKEKHEALIAAEEKELAKKTKQDGRDFFY